jgi:hypothetical protein
VPEGVAEAAADEETPAIGGLDLERADGAPVLARARPCRDHDRFGIELRLQLHQHVAAAGGDRCGR